MTRWLVSIPVWGERYVEEFCATALPTLDCAVVALVGQRGLDVRVIVHTDHPERIIGASGAQVECRPVPAGARGFDCMSQAHREVMALGVRGDVVVPMTAGAVISEQGLCYCADILDNPKLRVVLCAVPRVLAEGQMPDTANAEALMSWVWDSRHPMTRECTWPAGRSTDLSRTFYEGHSAVVTRWFLPHPLAIRVDGRQLRFTPTVDANLIHCFDPSEMYVVQDSLVNQNGNALAMVKLTPADKGFDLHPSTMVERAVAGELVVGDAHQRWCASHRIFLRGVDPVGCEDWQFMGAVRGGK